VCMPLTNTPIEWREKEKESRKKEGKGEIYMQVYRTVVERR
jgi:hypothetical protein